MPVFFNPAAGLTANRVPRSSGGGRLVDSVLISDLGGLCASGTGAMIRAEGGVGVAGMANEGAEMGYSVGGSVAFFQGYNRTASAFVATNVDGLTLRLNSNSGGVVLVGTTANSGNGRVQVATHSASSGGYGFGTSASETIYRSGTNTLRTFSNFRAPQFQDDLGNKLLGTRVTGYTAPAVAHPSPSKVFPDWPGFSDFSGAAEDGGSRQAIWNLWKWCQQLRADLVTHGLIFT